MEWLKLVHETSPPAVGFKSGDEVRVWFKILEQGKERLGQFEGTVIRCRGSGVSKTFTVRRVTHGEGVERVFPMDAPTIARIEVLRQGRVRRSRLYFLRTVIGKTRIASAETAGAGPSRTDAAPIVDKTLEAHGAGQESEDAVTTGPRAAGAADRPAPRGGTAA